MYSIDRRKLDSLDLISTNERLSKIARGIIEDVDHEVLKKNTYYDINLKYLLTKKDKLIAIKKRMEDNNATISQIYYSNLNLTKAGIEETDGMTKRCRPLLVLLDNNNTPQTTWPYIDVFSAWTWDEEEWKQAREYETNAIIYNPAKALTGYVIFENRSPYRIWDLTDSQKTPQLFITVFQDVMREEFENYEFPISHTKANLINAGIDLRFVKMFRNPVTTNQAEQGRANVGFGQYVAYQFSSAAGTIPYPEGEYKISFFLREPPLPGDTDASIALNQQAIYNFPLTKPLTILPTTP